MNANKLEEKEYTMVYVVYRNQEAEDYDWVECFDTKKQANEYGKENFYNHKIRVCASIDVPLAGLEYGYGDTQTEALNNLKKQVRPYGYLPYNPWKN